MSTEVTRFGAATDGGAYATCEVGGRWYFHPADRDWLAFNGNDEFSPPFATEALALAAAARWEAENDWE